MTPFTRFTYALGFANVYLGGATDSTWNILLGLLLLFLAYVSDRREAR